MFLKGYIIEKYNCMSNAYTCNRLVKEGQEEDLSIRIVGLHDTVITNHGVFNSGEPILPCDFVINRYKWGKIKNEIGGLAKKQYNSRNAFDIFVNKYEQVKRLHSSSFLTPRYCLGTAILSFRSIIEMLGSPFVAKGLESSMGEEVFLIENEAEYNDLLLKYGKEKEWLFQEFIENSYGKDIRFFSIRGHVVACMQRTSKNDFRANVALGASVEQYEVTDQIRNIARDMYNQTGLDFLGIDLLFGKEKPYFCEINVMPGLEGIESASGVNVAKAIVRTIKEDFRNE